MYYHQDGDTYHHYETYPIHTNLRNISKKQEHFQLLVMEEFHNTEYIWCKISLETTPKITIIFFLLKTSYVTTGKFPNAAQLLVYWL